ncbi:MAG: DUF4272 domain-containing protein [Actinomycetota bacterium]
MSDRPTSREAADRALVLYAFVRRGYIEHVLDDADADPGRVTQAERAREETEAWLAENDLSGALNETEARLLQAESGLWPPEAIVDAVWRKEALGTLLWALGHFESVPPYDTEFEQTTLDAAIVESGSVDRFQAVSRLRSDDELLRALGEADTWHGALLGAEGDEAVMVSLSAERRWALSWLLGDA